MTDNNADALVKKCMRVILSCENDKQLKNAINYCNLAVRKLANYVTNQDECIEIMEKLNVSRGYALGQIKNNKVN